MADDDDPYRAWRGRLFGIAYRLLGSAAEAEDVMQDAFLRLAAARRAGDEIESPTGFLVTVTTRIGIDRLRSARVRREQYPGQWLPEPVSELSADDPALHVEAADSISLAFLLLLERLGPVEHAVFVLRDVFDDRYDEVGAVVDRSPESCRQIALRARASTPEDDGASRSTRRSATPWPTTSRASGRTPISRVCSSCSRPKSCSPATAAARRLPCRSRSRADRVARALVGFAGVMHEHKLVARATTLNDDPGVFGVDAAGRVRAALALELGPGGIIAVRSQVNPDKLAHLSSAPPE